MLPMAPFPCRDFGDQSLAEFVPTLIAPLLIEGDCHPEGTALPRRVEDQLAVLAWQCGRPFHMRDQALRCCAETLGGWQGPSPFSLVLRPMLVAHSHPPWLALCLWGLHLRHTDQGVARDQLRQLLLRHA